MESEKLIKHIEKVYRKQNWIRYFEHRTTIYFYYKNAGRISFPLSPSQYKIWRELLMKILSEKKVTINNLTKTKFKKGEVEIVSDLTMKKSGIIFKDTLINRLTSIEVTLK